MRWICAREALLLQGIPILSALSFGKQVTGFASCTSSIRDTGRTATIGQAGNAMHSQCIAIALMYAVTQSNPPASSISVPRTLSSSNVSASASGIHVSRNDHATTLESDNHESRPGDLQTTARMSPQTSVPRDVEQRQAPGSSSVSLAQLMWMYSNNLKKRR